MLLFCFFFSSRRRHTRCGRDWSSDVCSSDLLLVQRLDKDATYILMYSNEMWETPLNVIAEECNGTLERFDIEVVEELLEEEYEKIEQEIEEKKQALMASAEEQEKTQLQEELDAQIGRASCRERV